MLISALPEEFRESVPDGSADESIALAFVSGVVPDEATYRTLAFHQAGQMACRNLLLALRQGGLAPSLTLTFFPEPSFPASRRLWLSAKSVWLEGQICLDLVPYINIPILKQLGIGLTMMWRLWRWGWRNRSVPHRVVFTYNLSMPPGLFTWLGAKLGRATTVVWINDINVPGQTVPNNWANRLDYRLTRWLMPRFDGHVSLTDRMMTDFAPGQSYLRIEGGVGPNIVSQTDAVHRREKGNESPFLIVANGRLEKSTGIQVILEAFSQLADSNYRLVITGRGSLSSEVKALAARDARVEYRGHVSFDEVLDLYNSADLLLCVSLTKAIISDYLFPSKFLEYLATGVPVIATCAGHIADEYSPYCYLLREETPQALAKMIMQVAALDPEERANKGRQARTYIRAHKTWEVQGRQVADYVRILVRSGRVAGRVL